MHELYIPFAKSKAENIIVDKIQVAYYTLRMQNPDLSVIIPAYNAEKTISACLDSIFLQNNADKYDVIVINDGSTDKTGRIVAQYQERHQNITLVNQQNAGVSTARNKGMDLATGRYITFVDADDQVGISYSCVHDYLSGKNNYVYRSEYNGLNFESTNFKTMPEFQPVFEPCYFTRMIKIADEFNADLLLANKITLNKEEKYISWIGYKELMYSGAYDKASLLIDASKRESANFALYNRDFLNNNRLRFEPAMSLDEDILFCMLAVLRAQKVTMAPESNYLYNRCYGTASNIRNEMVADYKYTIANIQRFSVLLSDLGQNPDWEELYTIQLREFACAGRGVRRKYRKNFAPWSCTWCTNETCINCKKRKKLDKQIKENIEQFVLQKQK